MFDHALQSGLSAVSRESDIAFHDVFGIARESFRDGDAALAAAGDGLEFKREIDLGHMAFKPDRLRAFRP